MHWIPTEAVAEDLGGVDWADRIIDLPDTVFAGYTVGMPVDIYSPTLEFDTNPANTINADKDLSEPSEIIIQSDPLNRNLSITDEVATIYVGEAVHWENNSIDQYPEVIISGNTGTWGSGVIEGGGDFITRFREAGFYHYSCRNAYDIDAPINDSCGTVTVVENNIED